MGFGISQDKYQYILSGNVSVGSDKNGREQFRSFVSYHSSLIDLLEQIKELRMRLTTIESKTLSEAISRIKAVNAEFLKALEPLKKTEASLRNI